MRQRTTLSILIQYNAKKETYKGMQLGKEEVKVPLVVDNMIQYLKDLRNPAEISYIS